MSTNPYPIGTATTLAGAPVTVTGVGTLWVDGRPVPEVTVRGATGTTVLRGNDLYALDV